MKIKQLLRISFFAIVLIFITNTMLNAQNSDNIDLLFQDKIDTLPINYRNSYYSECWGLTLFDEDYAVISSTLGTHIYQITDAVNSQEVAFIPSPVNGYNANWRDFHDYNGFLYIVNDGPSGVLQIVDLRRLPNEVTVVYESDEFFANAHNIFIDTTTAKLYVCGGKTADNQAIDLAIYDISNPPKPSFLNSYTNYGYIHDCFVRNDTAYLESPNNQTLYIVNFKDTESPQTLGSLSNYPSAGYTHAGWLSSNGQYYVLSDENYSSTIKLLDVSQPDDIKVITQFSSGVSDSSMVHNPIILGNFVFVSYYNDGLQVFDISDPQNVTKVGFYDTYLNEQKGDYRGAWGVYPFKDGKVVVSDRQTGLYVFDAANLMNEMVSTNTFDQPIVTVYPNPVNKKLLISNENAMFDSCEIFSIDGQLLMHQTINENLKTITINTTSLNAGLHYLILQKNNQIIFSKKILKKKYY